MPSCCIFQVFRTNTGMIYDGFIFWLCKSLGWVGEVRTDFYFTGLVHTIFVENGNIDIDNFSLLIIL